MYCKKCGTNNSNNSLRCKRCGDYLVNQYLNDELNTNDRNNNLSNDIDSNDRNNDLSKDIDYDDNSNRKSKNRKSKTNNRNNSRKRTKSNKKKKNFFNKQSNKDTKNNNRNDSEYNKDVIVRESFFSKITIIFLILLVLILTIVCSCLGLYILNDKVIKVPNVVGLNEYDAARTLDDKGINYEFMEKMTDNTDEFNIVLEQDKEAGKYILRSTTVIITVGSNNTNTEEKKSITLDNLIGKSKDDAIKVLEGKNINYKIIEIESSKEEGTVVKQSISPGDSITTDTVITLYISKAKDKNNTNNEDNDIINSDNSSEDDTNITE